VTDTAGADGSLALAAPANVTAEPGAGHVVLGWDRVPGAAGYVIERTGVEHTGEDGDGPRILAHGGSDVLAVPGPPFADTGLADAGPANTGIYRYRVGAVAGAEYPVWSWSAPVQSATRPGDPGPVLVRVDASAVTGTLNRVWRMTGSERLSQLLLGSDEAGPSATRASRSPRSSRTRSGWRTTSSAPPWSARTPSCTTTTRW
jgi:xylan 1,4-beta-xylosidase